MKAKILIVDDDEQIRRLLGRILENNGYGFAMASDAAEARELLKKQDFELILCDIGLPGESGLDFMRFALFEYPHTAGIIVTGQDDPISPKESLKIGIYDYITKPAERNRVLFSVANALQRRELEIANRAYRQDLEKMVAERTANLEETNLRLQQEIAERKRAKEVLKKSEQKYRMLINNVPGFVYQGYKDWSVDFVDNKVRELTSYDKEEFDSRTLKWSDIIFKEDVKAAKKSILQAFDSGDAYIREYRIKTKTAEILWIQDRGRIIRNKKGEIEYFSGVFFDITKQKQAREKLRENERYFRSLLAHIQENIVVVDRDYKITDANDSFLTIAGRTREETIGCHCYEVSHGYNEPCDRHGEDCKLLEVFETGEPRQCLHEHLSADGSKSWVDIILSPLKDEQNYITHVIEAARDVTDLLQTEEELQTRTYELGERVKELNCLYGISNLVEKSGISLGEILQKTTELMPPSWRYPEITCARIILKGKEYKTGNFKETVWKQTSDIVVHGERVGIVEVYYLEEKPEVDEGPFLKEESHLIKAIAERLGRIAKHKWTEEALRQSERDLAIRNKIAQIFLSVSDEDIYAEVLQVILQVMESEYGIFGYIDQDGALVCPSMTRDVWDRCQMPDKHIIFPREMGGGIWNRVLLEKKAFYSNGPFHMPEGHVPMRRALVVPFLHHDMLIGLIAVANKATNYGLNDREMLESIADYIAPVLHARLQRDQEEKEREAAEKQLRKYSFELEKRTSELEETLHKLEKTQSQLLQSEKMASVGQLAAGVAHEINNPTGFVSSNLKTLSEYINDISDLMREYHKLAAELKENTAADGGHPDISEQVERITALEDEIDIDFLLNDISELIEESREGTERIKKIVIDLKNFAHPGEDKLHVADINKGLESTLNVINNELKYKAKTTKDFGDLPHVECYPQMINQVFMNILVNAAQSIKERGEIRIKTRADNGYVEIKISDTGVGIPKENLSKIFDPFFTTKEVGKGTGLGLNVAFNIIKKHRGTIDVGSEVGKGTTFTVRIPVMEER